MVDGLVLGWDSSVVVCVCCWVKNITFFCGGHQGTQQYPIMKSKAGNRDFKLNSVPEESGKIWGVVWLGHSVICLFSDRAPLKGSMGTLLYDHLPNPKRCCGWLAVLSQLRVEMLLNCHRQLSQLSNKWWGSRFCFCFFRLASWLIEKNQIIYHLLSWPYADRFSADFPKLKGENIMDSPVVSTGGRIH